MFHATLGKVSLLKKVSEVVKDLVIDVPFDCDQSGMSLQAMDGSHISLVMMKLGAGLFSNYRCDSVVNFALSMHNLGSALKCAGDDETCQIKYNNAEGENVLLTFVDEKYHCKQDVTLKLMDLEAERLAVPEQQYEAIIEMPSKKFHKTVSDLSSFSGSLTITASEGKVVFEATGENGSNVMTFTSDEQVSDEVSDVYNKFDGRIKISASEAVKVTFSIKYLVQFSKGMKLADRVRLSISNRCPLAVEYQIEDDGYLRFYLAPKIEDEAEEVREMDA